MKTQSCSLPCWFGSEEWLKNFIQYFLRNTVAIIFNSYLNFIIHFFVLTETVGSYPSPRRCFLLFIYRIKCIVDKLRITLPISCGTILIFPMVSSKSVFIVALNDLSFARKTMISQSQIFIRQCIDICWFFYPAAASAVLQHAFYNSISSFAMMIYFFQVLF